MSEGKTPTSLFGMGKTFDPSQTERENKVVSFTYLFAKNYDRLNHKWNGMI